MITINKHPLFVEEVYTFDMPNHDFWKKEIDGVNRTFYSFKIQNVFLTETKKQETDDIPYE